MSTHAARVAPLPASLLLGGVLLAGTACGPALAPAARPPAPATVPTTLPAPTVEPSRPRSSRFTLPTTLAATGYTVQVRTELERDSAGRRDREALESSARVELTLQRDDRGSLRGTARVDSFLVRGGALTMPPASAGAPSGARQAPVPLPLVLVDVVLDSTQLRATVRPALANECDRPEAAAAGIAREILVRVPVSLSVGDRWRDTLATVVCRGGVQMIVRTVIDNVAEGASDGDRTLRVRRTLATRIDGSNRSPWRQAEISGQGQGTQEVRIDLARGTVSSIDGESTMVLRVRTGGAGSTRSEQVTQHTTLTVLADRR